MLQLKLSYYAQILAQLFFPCVVIQIEKERERENHRKLQSLKYISQDCIIAKRSIWHREHDDLRTPRTRHTLSSLKRVRTKPEMNGKQQCTRRLVTTKSKRPQTHTHTQRKREKNGVKKRCARRETPRTRRGRPRVLYRARSCEIWNKGSSSRRDLLRVETRKRE